MYIWKKASSHNSIRMLELPRLKIFGFSFRECTTILCVFGLPVSFTILAFTYGIMFRHSNMLLVEVPVSAGISFSSSSLPSWRNAGTRWISSPVVHRKVRCYFDLFFCLGTFLLPVPGIFAQGGMSL
jgi:hypothetical protein